MPHQARKISESGYYHVVPKALGGQIVFEDDADRTEYLELLRQTKDETGLRLHAYCLMSNHVHLIVEDPNANGLGCAMKYLHERYGMYFAERSGRTGGVFLKKLWSEPIERDEYLLHAVRYVHANPAVAGICPASAYRWSSVQDYLGRGEGLTDTQTVLEMLGGVKGFIAWSQMKNSTAFPFPGSHLRRHLNDEEALRLCKSILGGSIPALSEMSRDERNTILSLLHERGLGIAQLSRVTGLGRHAIEYGLRTVGR